MSLEAELLLVMLEKKHDKYDRILFVLKLFSAGQKNKTLFVIQRLGLSESFHMR
jgi:hypothetical protein